MKVDDDPVADGSCVMIVLSCILVVRGTTCQSGCSKPPSTVSMSIVQPIPICHSPDYCLCHTIMIMVVIMVIM